LTETRVRFPTEDGLALKGLLFRGEKGKGHIVLCHPHPLYGGDMYNNVIEVVQSTLAQKGYSTLRFNFRGIGGSEGGYGEGIGEVEDVRGAVAFVAAEGDGPLYLAGYSFGAYVGATGVAADNRVKALVCISPPVAMYDFTSLSKEGRPKLIVAGERDFICPVPQVEELFRSLSQPKVLRLVPGADHFWWVMEALVAVSVVDFLHGL
jgi:hypothetical protein